MPQTSFPPLRRRLDIKASRPAGGGPEYLTVTLIDPDDQDYLYAQGDCTLPALDLPLSSGITVGEFLRHWRDGTPNIGHAAREYGHLLYQHLLLQNAEIRDAWQAAIARVQQCGGGLRLEIRCPREQASHWMGQPVSALPFELLHDGSNYIFRRPGWSAVRRLRFTSRPLHLASVPAGRPRVQVAWANVRRSSGQAMDEALFTVHDAAVKLLDERGSAQRLESLPSAHRRELAEHLSQNQPHVLVWVGHGLDSGSGLLLHDGDSADYPRDTGCLVSASDFASMVRRGQVDVALLWSCHGAGTFRPLDVGVAEALLDPQLGDVAAVLASFASLDAAAVAKLSRDLIAAWGQAGNDLEGALASARGELDEHSLTWARPVLFLRTPPVDPGVVLLPPVKAQPPVKTSGLRWLPQLPVPTAHYVDHHQRLEHLENDLARHPVVVLEGLAGAGKTELALALAARRRASGEDVAFIDLTGQRNLTHLRQTLGLLVSETPFDDDAALFGALAARRWLLLLDNAEDVLEDEAIRTDLLDLLDGLRATGEGFRAIVTSRHALVSQGMSATSAPYTRELRLLDSEESRLLFIAAAGPRLAAAQATAEILDPLLTELGGVARAIVLMAGQLGGDTDVGELLRRLRELGPEAIAEEELYRESVPAALDTHVQKSRLVSALRLSLAAAERQAVMAGILFDLLGTLPGGLLQALLPQSRREDIHDALMALLDHHLVHLAGEDRRIMMASPVRAFAWQRWQAKAASGARPLLEEVHQCLATYASRLDDALGTTDAQAARLQFLAESSNLLQLVELRLSDKWAVRDDSIASGVYTNLCRFASKNEQYFCTPKAHTKQSHFGDISTSEFLGRLETLAYSFIAQAPGTEGTASSLFNFGELKRHLEDSEGALAAYEQALPIYRQIENKQGEVNTLRAIENLK